MNVMGLSSAMSQMGLRIYSSNPSESVRRLLERRPWSDAAQPISKVDGGWPGIRFGTDVTRMWRKGNPQFTRFGYQWPDVIWRTLTLLSSILTDLECNGWMLTQSAVQSSENSGWSSRSVLMLWLLRTLCRTLLNVSECSGILKRFLLMTRISYRLV